MTAGTLLKSFALGLDEQTIVKILEYSKVQPILALNINQTKGSSPRCSIMIDNPLIKIVDPNSYIYKRIGFSLIGCPDQGQITEPNGKKVNKQDIFMGETEVTQELYEAVMGYNPSSFKGKPDSRQRPVENVSWYDCIEFCNRLSLGFGLKPYYTIENMKKAGDSIKSASVKAEDGNGFRLPTEAEWEVFAKAGTQNEWSGTDNKNEVGRVGWYNKNSNNQTHPVAQLLPNEWGLCDMSGNVQEWCWDIDSSLDSCRVFRGGSWYHDASLLSFAFRNYDSPSYRYYGLGFRICRTIES